MHEGHKNQAYIEHKSAKFTQATTSCSDASYILDRMQVRALLFMRGIVVCIHSYI